MRARVLWVSLTVIILVALAVLMAGSYWFKSYLGGKDFLTLVSRLTGNAFQSEATYEPLSWAGSSVYSDRSTLEGFPGSVIKHVEAQQIRAEINWRAVFSGEWRIEDIAITQLNGVLGMPEKMETKTSLPPSSSTPSGLMALLPRRFEWQQVRIARANIMFAPIQASDVGLLIKPDGFGSAIQGSGGKLKIPWGPPLDILEFRARTQGAHFFLTKSELRLGNSGKVSASGESGTSGLLRVAWESILTDDVLDLTWRKHIHGTLSGSAEMDFTQKVQGTIQLHDGQIENIPMLASIADFTGNPSFRRMPVQQMDANFSYEGSTLKLTNVVAESKGLLRVEGVCDIASDGHINGRFQIGVTPPTLQWLPGSRERVFSTARNGYLWTDLVVGGTLENPTENLSARIATAMGEEVIKQGTDLIDGLPRKGVQSVLDLLGPSLP